MRSFFSIRPGGMSRRSLLSQTSLHSCRCRRIHPSLDRNIRLRVARLVVHVMRRVRVVSTGRRRASNWGPAMQQESSVFIGLDTSKMKIFVDFAEEGRQGEVRFFGDIEAA